jgi:RHS repeat-associated protein
MDIIGQQTNGTWGYFGYDGLGSVRGVFDLAGQYAALTSYAPYGSPFEQYNTPSTLGFTGEQTAAGGLNYLRARYYNPSIGTFLSRDPFSGTTNNAMSRNGYSYVHGNPTNWTDPSGKLIGALLIGGAILGGVISGAWNLFVEQGFGLNGHNAQGYGLENLGDWLRHIGECADWGEVIKKTVGGAVGGLVSVSVGAVFGAVGTLGGFGGVASGILRVVGGGIGNVAAGQTQRAVDNVLHGRPVDQGLMQSGDVAFDFVTGSVIEAVVSGAGRVLRLTRQQAAALAQREAEAYAASLRESGGRYPTAASAIVDQSTGEVYLGTSGRPYPNEIHPLLESSMPETSLEPWAVVNCAEFQACNAALQAGANMEDLVIYTVRVRDGLPFPRCANCLITTDGAYVPSD